MQDAKRIEKKINIDYVAKLANLELTTSEKTQLSAQLPRILEYVNTLSRVDTAGIEPLAHVAGLTNVWREDQTVPSLTAQEALANAKETHNDFFQVKAILDEI